MQGIIQYFLLGLIALGHSNHLFSQENKECFEEVFTLEEKVNFRNDTNTFHKNVFISYSVRVVDWEDQVVVSNVKAYKKENYLHFFSEQANIYQDEKEVVIIMPQQHLAIINSADKSTTSSKIGGAFFEMRKSFIDSCEVVKCEKNGTQKKLELKVRKNYQSNGIKGIVYEYDTDAGKILNVKINYGSGYKIKQLQINYKTIDLNSSYEYANAKNYLFTKNGKILPKYSGYEVIDNRDNKRKTKK